MPSTLPPAAVFARAEVGGKGIDPHLTDSPSRLPLFRFQGFASQDYHCPRIKAAPVRVESTSKRAYFFRGRAWIPLKKHLTCADVGGASLGSLLRRSEQQFQADAQSRTPILDETLARIEMDSLVPGGISLHKDAPVAAKP